MKLNKEIVLTQNGQLRLKGLENAGSSWGKSNPNALKWK